MSDTSEWLDTQTKSQLQKCPPDKLAPPDVDGYSLVLLERGTDHERVFKTIEALADDPQCVTAKCPVVLRRHLTLVDAMEGQFELICADSISVFLDDNVVVRAETAYLEDLYSTICESADFEPIKVYLQSVPDDENGKRFLRRFFGQVLGVSPTHTVPRRKAQIMIHWASKLGATVESVDSGSFPDWLR